MIDGFISIIKPSGMTSSDAVVKVRGILRRETGEKQKVGHLGTLDPNGAGVLPIAVGKAARLFDYLRKKRKTYIATFCFGKTTDTLDSYGVVTETSEKIPSEDEILEILPKFLGKIEQIPPIYSAISVGGVKAYKHARNGTNIVLVAREIAIYQIDFLGQTEQGHFRFKIVCEGGTYIRALARDIAFALGTVGYMSSIIRTKSGAFDILDSVTFEEFSDNPLAYILPVDYALEDFVRFDVPDELIDKVINGVRIPVAIEDATDLKVYVSGKLFCIGSAKDHTLLIQKRL